MTIEIDDTVRIFVSDASFSKEEPPLLRHWLARSWEPRLSFALVCMANPSYAGADENDPTIWNLIRLLQPMESIGGFYVVNWEPYIATDIKNLHRWREMMQRDNRIDYMKITLDNLGMIRTFARKASLNIIAWGNLVPPCEHTNLVLDAMSIGGTRDLYCLGETLTKAPKHPMARGKHRIPDGSKPKLWKAATI